VWRYYSSKSSGFSVRCLKNQGSQNSLPIVTTLTVSAITSTSAISGGEVTSDGGDPVNARGVCWSTTQNPNIANSLTTNGTGNGIFTSNLTGLYPNLTYYVRAYATNSEGTAYGNELSFSTQFLCGDNFTDSRDGKVYTTVQIGTQCWMKQNLNVGTRLDQTTNQTNNGNIEKYCSNNTEANCTTYGGLYQWDEMMQYSTTAGAPGICPSNWHLPTDPEWTIITTYLGGESIAGGKMKETGTSHWNSPNTAATNSSGFTGLPGGVRDPVGSLYDLGKAGAFWSSTQSSATYAWYRNLYYSDAYISRNYSHKSYGFSVRCVKD
jgi:uncharacterized protein (TIGR02145 family)